MTNRASLVTFTISIVLDNLSLRSRINRALAVNIRLPLNINATYGSNFTTISDFFGSC